MRPVDFLAVASVFVLSGSACTIAMKWQDLLQVPDSTGRPTSFEHPFFQTFLMFVGEFSCMGVFQYLLYNKLQKKEVPVAGKDYALPCPKWIYLIPAALDFTASTLAFIGLTLTYASVYGMLKGGSVLFTGLLSKFFLKRKFQPFHWLGMGLVVTGLTLVGLSSLLQKAKSEAAGEDTSAATNPMLGNVLIVFAQLLAATQFTFEEYVIGKYQIPPFEMVGWEGGFGLCFASIALGLFQLNGGMVDDFAEVVIQMSNSGRAVAAVCLLLLGVPVYNASAVTLTKRINATARMVLDTLRNIVVWMFTLIYSSLFGESFSWIQMFGFVFLVLGNGVFRGLIVVPVDMFRPRPDVVAPGAVDNDELPSPPLPERKAQQQDDLNIVNPHTISV